MHSQSNGYQRASVWDLTRLNPRDHSLAQGPSVLQPATFSDMHSRRDVAVPVGTWLAVQLMSERLSPGSLLDNYAKQEHSSELLLCALAGLDKGDFKGTRHGPESSRSECCIHCMRLVRYNTTPQLEEDNWQILGADPQIRSYQKGKVCRQTISA